MKWLARSFACDLSPTLAKMLSFLLPIPNKRHKVWIPLGPLSHHTPFDIFLKIVTSLISSTSSSCYHIKEMQSSLHLFFFFFFSIFISKLLMTTANSNLSVTLFFPFFNQTTWFSECTYLSILILNSTCSIKMMVYACIWGHL